MKRFLCVMLSMLVLNLSACKVETAEGNDDAPVTTLECGTFYTENGKQYNDKLGLQILTDELIAPVESFEYEIVNETDYEAHVIEGLIIDKLVNDEWRYYASGRVALGANHISPRSSFRYCEKWYPSLEAGEYRLRAKESSLGCPQNKAPNGDRCVCLEIHFTVTEAPAQ